MKTDFNLPHADRAFGVATRGPINQERCPLVIMCMRAENIPTGALSNVMCMAGLAGHYRVTPSGKIRVQEEEVNAIRRHGATRTATALQRVHRVIEKLEACGLRKAVLLSMGHASTPEAGQASSSTLGKGDWRKRARADARRRRLLLHCLHLHCRGQTSPHAASERRDRHASSAARQPAQQAPRGAIARTGCGRGRLRLSASPGTAAEPVRVRGAGGRRSLHEQ